MKFHTFVILLRSPFFLFILEGKSHLLEGEIDLSESPFALCQCAKSSKNDPCRNNYGEEWLIVNESNFHQFKDNQDSINRKSIVENLLIQIRSKNILILNLRNENENWRCFNSKDIVIFCSESIHQDVYNLKLTSVDEVVFLPEAIIERKRPLNISIRYVKKDLTFPANLYNYDYKIMDDDEWTRNQTYLNETFIDQTINIQLFEVQNVYLHSHSVSSKSLLLKIDGAKFLTIERTAVRNSDPDSLHSGLNLRKINAIKADCTWGSHVTIESCDQVEFGHNSLSESVYSVFLTNINNLKSYGTSFLSSIPKFSVILNVDLWEIIGNEEIILSQENSSLIMDKITIKEQSNTLVLNNSNIVFANIEEQQLLKHTIIISNSTFQRENNINSSLSMIAYEFNLEENQVFPHWVHLCQINDSIVCENSNQFRNVCGIGFPYPFNDTSEAEIKCQELRPRYFPDIPEIIIHVIIGGGLLLLVVLLIICVLLIYRYKKLVQALSTVELLHINKDYEDVLPGESNGHLKNGNSESSSNVTKM